MGRKNSLAKNSIQMLCVMQHLDEQNLKKYLFQVQMNLARNLISEIGYQNNRFY